MWKTETVEKMGKKRGKNINEYFILQKEEKGRRSRRKCVY